MTIPERLFPENLSPAEWRTFSAAGYQHPVTGVIYRGQPRPTCGMPLGGLDTGCLDIEPNGLLGYSTIFNHLVNPRLLLNLPFLGLSVGEQTWMLATDLLAKRHAPRDNPDSPTFPALDYTPQFDALQIGEADFQLAKSIDYWGHYPLLDLEFELDAPVSIGARLWAPFIPGDEAASLTPGFVCEFHLRNTTPLPQEASLVFSFPGFELPAGPAVQAETHRKPVDSGNLRGIQVSSGIQQGAWDMSYLLAVLDDLQSPMSDPSRSSVSSPLASVPGPPSPVLFRTGGPLNTNGQAWSRFYQELPIPGAQESGASLALDFTLTANESRILRLVFTWHAPHWRAGGAPSHTSSNAFTHRYAIHHPSALSAAQYLAEHHGELLRRVIAWQEAVHQHPGMPGWLADTLVNVLHLLPECSVWVQAKPPIGEWCDPQLGIFALNECPRGCPQMECLPCSFYGNLPVVYFFPNAARSTLEAYKAYQFPDGRPPWIFGGVTANQPDNRDPYDLCHPDTGYQTVLNGACVIIMADRYWRSTGDDAFLRDYWHSLKRCNDFSLNLRPAFGDAQVIAMPQPGTDNYVLGDTEWFEAPEPGWKGFVTHAGGVRLAQVGIMQRMAQHLGDQVYAERCERWLQAGAEALEQHLWAGRADTQVRHYLNFNDPDSGQRSELIFGYQLDGQWIADYHGIPPVFPPERARQTLETIRQANCTISRSGATNYANPDGSPAQVGGYGTYGYFPPELYMLACTYIYAGEREFGLELLHRCLDNLVKWGYLWDMPNIVRGDADTGERAFGADYYQNLMLWALPAALDAGDLTLPLGEGGLVTRVLQAGKDKK